MIAPLHALLAAAAIHLDGGTSTATIAELLRLEGVAIERAPENAAIRATIRREERSFDVDVVSRSGTPILTRSINVDRGLDAAHRMLVLLLMEALAEHEVRELPPPRAQEPLTAARGSRAVELEHPPASELALRLLAGVSLSPWRAPEAIAPGVQLSARAGFGRLRAGVGLLLEGCHVSMLADCTKQIPHTLEARASAISVLAETEVELVALGPVDLAALASGGLVARTLELHAIAYGPGARPERHEVIEGLARAGAVLQVSFFDSYLHLRVAGGAAFRFDRLTFQVAGNSKRYEHLPPEERPSFDAVLDPGAIVPWIEVGAVARLF